MRALRYDGQSVTLERQWRDPTPAPGEAVVRPILTGICSSDTEILRGGAAFTGTLGHEFVGVVEELNIPANAPAWMVEKKHLRGKRVVGSINIVCGTCDLCKRGLANHCRTRSVLGIAGRDGVFADRFTIPVANLVAVPDTVDDDHAVFAEPLSNALHVAQMFRVEGKPYITVIGDGKLGLLTVQVMARLNASVRLIGKHPEKFGLCERWGIKHRHLDEVGRRQDQDVVVDCTGNAGGLALAMGLVRPRGKIILASSISPLPIPQSAGTPMPGANHPAWSAGAGVNLAPLVINEIELIGSRCGSIPDAVAALARNEIHVAPLITKRGTLDDAPALLAAAGKGQLKVLIDHRRAA